MYNSDTELMFPQRVISTLRDLRGESWQALVDSVDIKEDNQTGTLGFVLMMVKLGGCVNCNADSFRAMKGCTQCAAQIIRRYRGSDSELLEQFKASRNEIEKYLKKHPHK